MHTFISRMASLVAASLIVCVNAPPVRADDTEIFFTQTTTNAAANLMLIFDTSGSMHRTAVSTTSPQPYKSELNYILSNPGAGCDSNRIYYRTGANSTSVTAPTSCSEAGLQWFTSSWNKCQLSKSALEYGAGKTLRSGYYQDNYIRWGGANGATKTWNANLGVAYNSGEGKSVECKDDAGTYGDGTGSSNPYPRPGTTTNQNNGLWGTLSQQWWQYVNGSGVTQNNGNLGVDVVLWSPNRIAYQFSPPTSTITQSRMEVLKAAATSLLNSPQLAGMNVGLMRYDAGAEGGMVLMPTVPIDEGTNRTDMIALINGFVEAGGTPLSETLFEAYRYFSGGAVDYGNDSRICTANAGAVGADAFCTVTLQEKDSVADSRTPANATGANYNSPADASCQNNYIVFLTDGEPTSDTSSNTDINALSTTDASCSGIGGCLATVAAHMYGTDSQPADLRPTVDGNQHVKTYFIGFGDEFAGGLGASAFQYLVTAAEAGGGHAFQANDLPQLEAAFNSIVADVNDTDVTFTAPTVAVNAFNRTQTLNDLYVSVFQPKTVRHWPGNLKKYSIVDGIIKDFNNADAVNPATGFFKNTARSIWSAGTDPDGADVTVGGAANLIPDPSSRSLYTYINVNTQPSSPVDLTLTSSKLDTSNGLLTNAVLGLSGASGEPTRDKLIDWSRGEDAKDQDSDGDITEPRNAMGDSIHAQPAIVIYGNGGDLNDAMVYMPTNDGYLHAVDVESGEERWAFVPQELLPNLKALYYNETVATHQYALDGDIRVLKYDVNGNGRVDGPDDRVILFFGQGRGGSHYYAIDVTAKEAPKFLWSIGTSVLPDIGQTWSPPTLARVVVSDKTQNSQKLVLIVGGGYDPVQDGAIYVPADSVGNRVYMIDALKGTLLWSAGSSTSNANLKLGRMTHSIPSAVAVLDTDQDGFADRMYVGDMAAQLWRFDITTGNTANTLVAGGVLASLGNHDAGTTPTAANARRFYNAPDVAAVQTRGKPPYMNIALGSGYRGHPLNEDIQDRFYAIRDDKPFTKMTPTDYTDFVRITDADADLQDITNDVNPTLLAGVRGWKLKLNQPGNTWQGEKVLTSSNTFNNMIFFTTYIPTEGTSSSTCTSGATAVGQNRTYIVSLFDGSPVPRNDDGVVGDNGDNDNNGGDNNGDGQVNANDRFNELSQTGIAPEVSFLFPQQDSVTCLSGVEVLSACRNFNSRVKTYWRETGAN